MLKTTLIKIADYLQSQSVLYLPTLELRTTQDGTEQKEDLHVIKVGQAGRGQVHVLHW